MKKNFFDSENSTFRAKAITLKSNYLNFSIEMLMPILKAKFAKKKICT